MKLLPLFCVLAISCHTATNESSPHDDSLSAVFEPGLISNGYDNRDLAISPNGNTLYFTIQHENRISIIMQSNLTSAGWTEPVPASFSGKYKDLEPAFSYDGTRLYFASNRPLNDSGSAADFNIWYMDQDKGTWSQPLPLDSSINSSKDEYYPSLNKQNDLYFTRDNGSNREDIFVARFSAGRYQAAQPLSEGVNGTGYEFNAFVDPDNRFIIFTSYGRPDDLGSGDLYISHWKDSAWMPALHFDAPVNSASIDYCPYISPDGQYFYFTSSRMIPGFLDSVGGNREKLWKALAGPGNGSDDIYRIAVDSLALLKR